MRQKILDSNTKYNDNVSALLHKLSEYSEEMLNRTPENGGWSAIQTAWHLLLVEELSLKYTQKKLHYGGTFEKVGFLVYWRSFLLQLFLVLPFKFKAPANSSGESLPAHSTLSELGERWAKARMDWANLLTQLPDDLLNKSVYKHPRVGRIGWLQMLSFFSTHFDRHLKQIRKALVPSLAITITFLL